MKENKKVDTNNTTIHYDEGVDEKTTIRIIEYDGEEWYNAADLTKHLKVLFDSMREINGLVGELDDTIKKRLK